MAEIFMLTRGHKDHVEKWERCMRAQFFPMKFKKTYVNPETGEKREVEEVTNVEGQLRPYQLWGYVCPEEYVQPLCNNLGIPQDQTWFNTKTDENGQSKGGNSFMSGFGVKGHLEAFRIALRAKKLIKDLSKGYWPVPIYRQHVNILGIGWRPDVDVETPLGKHEGI